MKKEIIKKNKLKLEKYTDYYEGGSIKYECHFLNKKIHNEGGPAIIWYNQDVTIEFKCYYLNGKKITTLT